MTTTHESYTLLNWESNFGFWTEHRAVC